MKDETLAGRLAKQGKYADLREYQQLKVAKDMEREATARYKESLKRKHGEAGAEKIMRKKGYDPHLAG